MRSQSLDVDLLDEEVKKNLGYIDDSEIMIYQEKGNKWDFQKIFQIYYAQIY